MLHRTAVKGVVLSLIAWSFTAPARAQEVPTYDIFGGYSFLRSRSQTGGALFSFSTDGQAQKLQPVDGFDASITRNVNRWAGITADLSGYYSNAGIKTHSLMVGPQFSFRQPRAVTPFLHGLFGASYQSATRQGPILEGAFGGPGVLLPPLVFSSPGLTGGHTSFAMALGGGVDYNVNRSVSLRLIQADYLRQRFAFTQSFGTDFCTGTTAISCTPIETLSIPTEKHNNLRLSFGVVFHP